MINNYDTGISFGLILFVIHPKMCFVSSGGVPVRPLYYRPYETLLSFHFVLLDFRATEIQTDSAVFVHDPKLQRHAMSIYH